MRTAEEDRYLAVEIGDEGEDGLDESGLEKWNALRQRD